MFTEESPIRCIAFKVMGDEPAKRIDQNGLAWSESIDCLDKLTFWFSDTPVVGATLPVILKPLLPIPVIRSSCGGGDVSDDGMVMQQMLCPTAFTAAGWAADEDQAAALA